MAIIRDIISIHSIL